MDREFHEAANIFPMMGDDEFNKLVEDIRSHPHGLIEPILLFEGKILDGRNRYKACLQLNIKPKFSDVTDVPDPVAYVLSLNLHRRHLTQSQMAMVGDRARDLYDKQAKERHQSLSGRPSKDKPMAPVPQVSKGTARDQAGKVVGVGGRTMDNARNVRKHGIPELIKAVDEGKIAVRPAAEIAKQPPEVQRQEVAAATKGVPKKPAPKPKPVSAGSDGRPKYKTEVSSAMDFAVMSISQLERIRKDDPKRKEAFTRVLNWIKERL